MRPQSLFLWVLILGPLAHAGDFLGRPKAPTTEEPPKAAVPPASQPIERFPAFSPKSVTGRFNSKAEFEVTSIDRNSDTAKEWLKSGVITKEKIESIEAGHPEVVELPDAH